MRVSKALIGIILLVCAATSWGQTPERIPQVGYVFPGGGQRGTTFNIIVGGQFINSAKAVHISGEGISAKFVKYYRLPRNLMKEQRVELQNRLKECRDRLLKNTPQPVAPASRRFVAAKPSDKKATPTPRPFNHPLIENLESKSLRQLQEVTNELFASNKKKQLNAQIGEMVMMSVTIDKTALLGDRELRLITNTGLTNPIVFQVGSLPEVKEQEPNDPKMFMNLPPEPPLSLPVVVNGQIKPGDVDRLQFRARQGQSLVVEANARRLIPFLADAVPGWFQATLALYDAKGNELAFADDYRFNPDPVLYYKIPTAGIYELEIRDAIYRGRDDFVYRVAISERPFITAMYPLGAHVGDRAIATVSGWNMQQSQMSLNTSAGFSSRREAALRKNKSLSNRVPYAVDTLPEANETEPNSTLQNAQRIQLPRIVNGRIAKPGDVDIYRFNGKSGEKVVAEVVARQLNSPIDSVVKLTTMAGKVIEWNDDFVEKDGHLYKNKGLLTHHADSYLTATLPKDGAYCVQIADAQNQGGEAYGYRLRISPPQPDFVLQTAQSSMDIPAGRDMPLTIYALRKDGFDGPIDLALKNAPEGFVMSGGRIPAGANKIRVTLRTPAKTKAKMFSLKIEGSAKVGKRTITREITPADDRMQAYLWRHLSPAKEFLVTISKMKYRITTVDRIGKGPVEVPSGGMTLVEFQVPKWTKLDSLDIHLNDPPLGLMLLKKPFKTGIISFEIETDSEVLKPGFADNLIVEAFTNTTWTPKGGTPQKRRVSVGTFPAIPIEVVQAK